VQKPIADNMAAEFRNLLFKSKTIGISSASQAMRGVRPKPPMRKPKAASPARFASNGGHSHNDVTYQIPGGLHHRLEEEATAEGKTAAALMTELLEAAVTQRQQVRYPVLRAANATASSSARIRLHERYANRLVVNPLLTRKLVSFQASKTTPFYRWLKYKEAFSPELVDYLFDCLALARKEGAKVLDPFAGTGTALTRASARRWKGTGIELLPVGVHALHARFVADRVNPAALRRGLAGLNRLDWSKPKPGWRFPHLRITQGAFSPATEAHMSAYLRYLDGIADADVRFLLWFACLSVLEEVSFTRKDGQYLRWDNRSGRTLGRPFDKGRIVPFREGINERLSEFQADLETRNGGGFSRNAAVIEGSCLVELPKLPEAEFDVVLTSPPYCNRYDYTRTYALELAFCGSGEDDIRRLRQTLLSATVENKSKRAELSALYAQFEAAHRFGAIEAAYEHQAALQEVLGLLYAARDRDELSNNNVPSLVANYFLEMAQVVFELARVVKPGGHVIMVNDNVRYQGEEVPVDLILSDFAESAGLVVEKIWVLPRGKGNSSQQMGRWGRQELRKCVYLWRRP